MKSLLTVLLLLSVAHLNAQNHDVFNANFGYVITHSDSINGTISIDMESNTILLRTGSVIENYSAKQFSKVVFFDDDGVFKTIVSGYWGADHQAYLFEELVSGDNPLLYRSGMKFNEFDAEKFPPYFTKQAESIYSLGKKKDILNLFRNEDAISDFVRKNKLKMKVKQDLILLFSLANGVDSINAPSIAIDEI